MSPIAVLAVADGALDAGRELSLADWIALSGAVGWAIIALSAVTLALVIENYRALARERLAPPELIDRLQALFDAGKFDEALALCENQPTFLTRVVAAGLAKVERPFDVIQTALEERGDDEAVRLHQRIGWISVAATIAPMLGLFGTVWGMASCFRALATTVDPTPAQLASGIYVALATTLESLLVAIPAVLAFVYLRNRLVRAILDIGVVVEDLFDRLRPDGGRTSR